MTAAGRTAEAAAPIPPERFAASLGAAFGMIAPTRVLLAVSGGPDSTALLHAAARWAAEGGGPALAVATVDHRLRPGSCAEAEAVGAAAAALGLPHAILTCAWAAGSRPSQARARAARYRLLAEHAAMLGTEAVALAHTRDDQAETIMIRLAAGSGPTGLAGMRPIARRDGLTLIRPLLGFAKSELVATCRQEGWSFVEDPSNSDPRFTRVRWRALMPALAAEGLDARRLARLADRVARAEAALDAAAAAALANASAAAATVIDLSRLAREPNEIVVRALARVLGGVTPVRLERLEAAVDALLAGLASGRTVRRTLAGHVLSLGPDGTLRIASEPQRRRGRTGPLTVSVSGSPHSLGIGCAHA